jgi:hypothetical protein
VSFKSQADAERWYTTKIDNYLKSYVPHSVVNEGVAYQLWLGPPPLSGLSLRRTECGALGRWKEPVPTNRPFYRNYLPSVLRLKDTNIGLIGF